MSEIEYYSDRFVKGKYRCSKKTPNCAIYPWATRKAGRIKCVPCDYLEVQHPDGTITSFSDNLRKDKT